MLQRCCSAERRIEQIADETKIGQMGGFDL